MGQMKLALLGRADDLEDDKMEEEWDNTTCPAIVILLINKQKGLAAFWMNATG